MVVNKYKKCPHCGAKNDVNAKFCLKCGSDLKNVKITTDLPGTYCLPMSLDTEGAKVIPVGAIPAGYSLASTVEVIGGGENYMMAWRSLMESLNAMLPVKHFDGIANYRVLSPFQTSIQDAKLTLILYGDGITKDKGQ